MTTFIRTRSGSAIALHQIANIAGWTNRDGNYIIGKIDGHNVEAAAPVVESTVVSIIPAEGWECLFPIEDDANRPSEIFAEPIIAWGLNPFGHVMPIVPSELGPETTWPCGLRRIGSTTVYVPNDGSYKHEAAWLADLQRRHDETAAKKATKDAPNPAT